jgi:TnpA family transposase
MINKNHKNKIHLLNELEIEELYGIPQFTNVDREYFFQLDENEHKLLKNYTNLKSKVFLILQLGYFKAKQQFFKFKLDEVKEDVNYVIKKYYTISEDRCKITGNLWKEINRKQKADILRLHQYREWSNKLEKIAIKQLEKLIRLYPKGNDTLRELFVFFDSERIMIPSYRTIQDLFTRVFKTERMRLDAAISEIPENLQKRLDDIIKNENGLTYLNIIRMDQKDFSYTALKREVKKAIKISPLYQLCKTLIPSLGLSNNAVRYYASLAEQYTASRLRKLKVSYQRLQILCFIFNRYQEFIDNLITSFMFHLRAFMNEGKQYADEKENEFVKGVIQELPNVGQFFSWFSNKDNNEIKQNISVKEFKQIGFDILPKEKQLALVNFMLGSGFDKKSARWDYYESQSRRIAMYFRPILLAVDFEFYKPDALIVKLIKILRDYYSSDSHHSTLIQTIPPEVMEKIPNATMTLLKCTGTNEISDSRFEFHVYEKMYHQIDRGRLFCNDSVSYCDLDYDLVADELVDQAKEICDEFGYKKIPIYCDERLDQASNGLEDAWTRTNDNIDNGSNQGIKIETYPLGVTTWKLTYDANTEESTTFFDELPKSEIADIMKFMGDYLKIWLIFESQKDRYVKIKHPSPWALIACILSDAFSFEIEKMSQMSNINYNHLRTVDENFMYVDSLKLVNDAFSNYVHNLPVSRAWDLIEDTIVSDADGQKYETSRHTIQSRYSSKYFGAYKGISIYSLTANHISVNAKVIAPNEHESHHLYDVIFNNKTNVPIHMVTGDGHSINQTSFVTLDSIDVEFIPSIKNIREEAEKLYSMHDPDEYKGLIKPHDKIKLALIKSEKRGIMRILLSLLLQKNTQAVIVRKLASHKRYTRLQAAFWEYNKIFKSTHVLNLINDEKKRKIIKTARNRTESYHQFHRTIRKIFSGVFKGRKIVSNAISIQASRLVSNCVIAYNAMLLNKLYLRLCATMGEEKAKAILQKISPVAWQHIIFTGRYHFKDQDSTIDFDKLISLLEKKLRKPA